MGGGLGSLLAQQFFKHNVLTGLWLSSAAVALFWLLWVVLWGFAESSLQSHSLTIRASLTALSLLPLALCLGMPFALSLSLIKGNSSLIALSWAINGVFSVLGSVVATALGMLFGFQLAAFLVAAYALVVLFVVLGLRAKSLVRI